jgi:hypothetical protein
MIGLVLDAGALIAYERNDRRVQQMMFEAIEGDRRLVVPAGVVGQVWRDGRKQARLARLFNRPEVEIEVLNDTIARRSGALCGAAGTADVIDASVVLCGLQRNFRIITSDPDDLLRIDPRVQLVVI